LAADFGAHHSAVLSSISLPCWGSERTWQAAPVVDFTDTEKTLRDQCREATFKKGVLTVTLPKKPEAQKPAKKIEVKDA
jgi:hypothetical protein